MRTAFSMNDLQVRISIPYPCSSTACDESILLQTLQVYEAEAAGGGSSGASWNPRLVSRGHARKPSLASVPEGAGLVDSQPAVNLMPMGPMSGGGGYQQPLDGFTFTGRQPQQAGPSGMMPVQSMHPVGMIPPGHQVFSNQHQLGQQVNYLHGSL